MSNNNLQYLLAIHSKRFLLSKQSDNSQSVEWRHVQSSLCTRSLRSSAVRMTASPNAWPPRKQAIKQGTASYPYHPFRHCTLLWSIMIAPSRRLTHVHPSLRKPIYDSLFFKASPLSLSFSLYAPLSVLFLDVSLCVCFRRRIAHYGAVHQLGAWTGHHGVRTVHRWQRRAAVEDDVEQHQGRCRPLRQGRRSRNRGDKNKASYSGRCCPWDLSTTPSIFVCYRGGALVLRLTLSLEL